MRQFSLLTERFLRYAMANLGLSYKTIQAYKTDFNLFNNYLDNEHITLVSTIDHTIILEYLAKCNYSSATYNRKIASFRNLFRYLIYQNEINIDLTKLKHVKLSRHLPTFLTFEDIKKLVQTFTNNPTDFRNKTIVTFLYATGLRVSELCYLKFSNLNMSEGYVRCLGKGNKERFIYCGSELLNAIFDEYFSKIRPQILKSTTSEYIFVNKNGTNLSRIYIFKFIKAAISKAKIHKNVSPHTLRHSFASDLILHGADIRTIQELLGHSSIKTTEIYTHLKNIEVENKYREGFIDITQKKAK